MSHHSPSAISDQRQSIVEVTSSRAGRDEFKNTVQ